MGKHMASGIGVLSVLLFSGIVWAQVTTGTISGTAKDSSGAVLPGIEITVLNEDTGIFRTLLTDENGHYSAVSLSLGNYRVTGSLQGFQTAVRSGIVLTVGREAVVDLSLMVGAVTDTLEVRGEAPLVESTTASLGALVDERTIRELPLNGRSYDQLALLQPGVILTSPGRAPAIGYTFGTGSRFSVGGQNTNANLFLLDGTNVNDQANGTPGGASGTNLGVDAIREFRIFTNSYKAEFGHSTGSVVTAVTRSGTNTVHGTAFEYIRNSALDARNFFDTGSSPPPFKRNQFGGVLGGPIKKDKTFFFAGYEGLRQVLGTSQIAIVPTALARQGILPTGTVSVNSVVRPYLDLYPLPNGAELGEGEAEFRSAPNIVTNGDNVMGRVDHQLNENNSIFVRYTFDRDSVNAPQNLPNRLIVSASRRQYTTLQVNSILGHKALNNFRFAFNRTYSAQNEIISPPLPPSYVPGQPLGGLSIGGLLGFSPFTPLGTSSGAGPALWAWNVFEWGDDFSYITGKHSFKTGVDIQRLQDNTTFNQQLLGNYTFANFNDFLAGRAQTFGAGSPVGVPAYWGLRQTLFAVYGQDDYTVNSRLTLNFGFRWEAPTDPRDVNGKSAILPSFSATSMEVSDSFLRIGKKNFEPRFGLAWKLDNNGKTVLRMGGGIYHNQILPWAFSQQTRTPPFYGLFLLNNPPFPDAYKLLTTPAPGSLGLNIMAPFNKTPVTHQYNLSIQREIARNTVVQVAYVGNKANHTFIATEEDSPIPTICSTLLNNCPAGLVDGTKYYPAGAPRRNPAWNGQKIISSNGNSIYNAGTVTLQRQSSSGLTGQISYTYSKAMDVGTSISGSQSQRSPSGIMDPEDRARDWALSDFNSTHIMRANFSYPLPFKAGGKALGSIVSGWTFDGILTFTGGMPFTITDNASNVSRNRQTTGLADRPDLKPGFSSNPTKGVSAGCPGLAAGTPVGTAEHWFDPCAFSMQTAGTYGNLGRNTAIGPGAANVDFALVKSFKVRDQANATFRAEVFNAMNHANLGLPVGNALTAAGTANPTAGKITYTTTSSRQIQFGLRINF